MTLAPTTVTSAELASLADQANEAHRRFVEAFEGALTAAIEVGHVLLKANELVSDAVGEWPRWVEEHCDFHWGTAALFQRLAHYEHEIKGETSISSAKRVIRGLPPIRKNGAWQVYPAELRETARAMLAEGQLTQQQIAERLGVDRRHIGLWKKTDKELRQFYKARGEHQRAAHRALKEQKQREAVLALANTPVAEFYSRLRRTLEAVDPAIKQANTQEAAKLLREAREALYKAEARLVKALGVE